MTCLATPILLYTTWSPQLLAEVLVIQKDEVPYVYYPSVAVLQNVNWSSQANITLETYPKCSVGWLVNDLPVCDAVDNLGDWCDCAGYWDTEIQPFQWHNTTYKMLSWNPSQYMINVSPTTPLLVQVFFNYNSDAAFTDSFTPLSPSLWLAIWDAQLSLEESLQYGYTQLQLIDDLAMSSINLGLSYKEEPPKKPAYDYELSAISTVPQASMTCDVSSDKYLGACHMTVLIQYPTFHREVTSIERMMQWTDVAAAVGSWISVFQIIGWVVSGLAME
ncbi:hypothetical protein BX600DRAFT_515196 [Xylariales sp. PMI_506]|nr:hypothetical protein BX600DRAFT_515196 [Xylariales sp. PMI_506]